MATRGYCVFYLLYAYHQVTVNSTVFRPIFKEELKFLFRPRVISKSFAEFKETLNKQLTEHK